MSRLEEIAGRLEAATPGPLHVASQAGASTGLWRVLQDGYETPLTHPDASEFGKFARLEDAVFAAFAPADLAALLAVVREVAAANDRYMCGEITATALSIDIHAALNPLTEEETDE